MVNVKMVNVKMVNEKILDLGAIILTFILVPSATIKLSPLFGFQNVLGKLTNALKGGEIQNFDHLKKWTWWWSGCEEEISQTETVFDLLAAK